MPQKKLSAHEVNNNIVIYMFNISKYVILIKRNEQTWASQCSYCFLLRFRLHSMRWYSLCLLPVELCEPLRGTCYSPRARLQKIKENLKASFYFNKYENPYKHKDTDENESIYLPHHKHKNYNREIIQHQHNAAENVSLHVERPRYR